MNGLPRARLQFADHCCRQIGVVLGPCGRQLPAAIRLLSITRVVYSGSEREQQSTPMGLCERNRVEQATHVVERRNRKRMLLKPQNENQHQPRLLGDSWPSTPVNNVPRAPRSIYRSEGIGERNRLAGRVGVGDLPARGLADITTWVDDQDSVSQVDLA